MYVVVVITILGQGLILGKFQGGFHASLRGEAIPEREEVEESSVWIPRDTGPTYFLIG